jgi:hypothetical protein
MVSFLSKEQIAQAAPSVLAKSHDGLRSDRYTFVDSEQVIDTMADLGWGVADAQQPRSFKSDPAHSKHLVRFRPLDQDLAFRDPRSGGGLVFPEIINYNSSNGTSRWRLESGAFTMVCSNGLTIRVPGFEHIGEEFSRKHIAFDPQLAYDAVQNMAQNFGGFFDVVSEMTQRDLTPGERTDFAVQAREIRGWDDSIDPAVLLSPRRAEDTGSDVWTTFNVLQENLVRGGIKLAKRRSRTLSNIDQLASVNAQLWDAAERVLVAA